MQEKGGKAVFGAGRRRRPATALLWLLAVAAIAGAAGAADRPGERFELRPADLPAPFATESVSNPARLVPRPADATLQVPAGFAVGIFAEGLEHPRWMVAAPDGGIFLAESNPGRILYLRDGDGDGVAEVRQTVASGFARPHGMALRDGALWVADTEAVWRLPLAADGPEVAGPRQRVTAAGALGGRRGHWTRGLVFAPDGGRFFVAIGSRSNLAVEPEPRATVRVFPATGGGGRTFAAGLRNPVGIAFHPDSGGLWVVVNERDGMGDGLVPDYLALLEDGSFHGWPFAWTGPNPQPGLEGERPDLVARARLPDLLFESHSAPLGLVFLDGEGFPGEWRGDAFVALHGSWNAARPTGYKVVRVPFRDGRPEGGYENFATGFRLDDDGARAVVMGRPAGLVFAADGALLVADDAGGAIWRITWTGGE